MPYPSLEAISAWLGQGAVHPPPFSLDAAEAVVEEAIMVRKAMAENGWTAYIRPAAHGHPPAVGLRPPQQPQQ